MPPEKKTKKRINNISAMLMIVTCFFLFDLTQIILEWLLIGFLFNWMITGFATYIMWIWFKFKGVFFLTPTKLAVFLGSFGIDITPGTDASIFLAFTWTVSTIILILISRVEDKTGIKIPLSPKKLAKDKK